MRNFIVAMAALLLVGCSHADDANQNITATTHATSASSSQVLLKTSHGDIKVVLYDQKAPISVRNFKDYVETGSYDGTIFHRVIPGFMIQGGGMNSDLIEQSTFAPIKNEADNGLRNLRGTLAMARTNSINSATSQFFINLKDNSFLDHSARSFGYAVFGKVIEGMDVVDQIAKVQTGKHGYFEDVPIEPVIIKSAEIVQE